jgi:glycerophosphoryl diester phosphodiesterase
VKQPAELVRPNDRAAVPAVIAHRGYSATAPENTLVAIDAGARAGADWVEIDVATSADGIPYVLHDSTVDRTTAGTGALHTLPSSVLDTLEAGEWFSPVHRGEPLPRLSAALDRVERVTAGLLLEIKGPKTRAELETIVGLIRARGLLGRVLLQSFHEGVLEDAHAIEPSLRLGLLRDTLDPDPVAVARALHVSAYNPAWEALATRRSVVAELNAAGVAVMPYTIDHPDTWLQARDAGVDGIITNRPGELWGWNARYRQGGVPLPPRGEILSPAPGAVFTRADVVPLAFDTAGSVAVARLDGVPVAHGAAVRADTLALGEHRLELAATAPDGATATREVRFTVAASATGVAALIATHRDLPDPARVLMLELALSKSWGRLAAFVHAHEAELGETASARILEEATALRAIDGDGPLLAGALVQDRLDPAGAGGPPRTTTVRLDPGAPSRRASFRLESAKRLVQTPRVVLTRHTRAKAVTARAR